MTDTTQQTQTRRRSPIRDILATGAQAIVLFLVLSALIGRFEVHQISMEPTFHEGQRVLVSKLDTLWSGLFLRPARAADGRGSSPFAVQRGQVVVFYRSPTRDDDALIKRVIGLPGDTIEISAGQVKINGAVLDEPYVHGVVTGCSATCGPLTLADDQYYVMGDNRLNSLDSRNFGSIPASQIIGRVVMRYWPLGEASWVS